jgi:hypothetical protein
VKIRSGSEKAGGNDFMMVRIREHDYDFTSEDGYTRIRSIVNADLSYYPDWFARRFMDGYFSTLTEDTRFRMIKRELDGRTTFIVEIGGVPSGEISLWKDPAISVKGGNYRPPYFSVWSRMYVDQAVFDGAVIISLLIRILPSTKMKIGSLYAMIDRSNIEQEKDFVANEFTAVANDLVSTKLEKYFTRFGIQNPIATSTLLFRRMKAR